MIEHLSDNNLEEVLDICEKSYAESIWKNYPFNRVYLKGNLTRVITDKNCFTCLYRKDGKIVGYFLASLGRFLFSDALLGMESGMYVLPECRGGLVAHVMCQEFISWCKNNKAEPFFEIYFGGDNEKTYQFLSREGMEECGKVFRGGINGVR